MKNKKCFIRDGLEIFNPEEVERIEQVSKQQLERDLRRASTWIECGDYEKAKEIIRPLEGRV